MVSPQEQSGLLSDDYSLTKLLFDDNLEAFDHAQNALNGKKKKFFFSSTNN